MAEAHFYIRLVGRVGRLLPATLRKRLPRAVVAVEIAETESRRINRVWRRRNAPANVLSFRYGSDYGEILLCPAVIRREAAAQKTPYGFQMTRMLAHAMVHLAELHHETSERSRRRAEILERRIMKELGMRN